MSRSVTVEILGQKLALRSDADAETLDRLATYVDQKIRHIQHRSKVPDSQAVVLLAALQIAEELFEQRRRLEDLKGRIREKSRAILQYLEGGGRV